MYTSIDDRIQAFLTSKAFAVLGASQDRSKYGNKVLRCYVQNHKKVYPVNPKEKSIEQLSCLAHISELPPEVQSISIITPPKVTENLVQEAIAHGIRHIWMQPGAESDEAIWECERNQVNVIAGGPCLLVVLGFKERAF